MNVGGLCAAEMVPGGPPWGPPWGPEGRWEVGRGLSGGGVNCLVRRRIDASI